MDDGKQVADPLIGQIISERYRVLERVGRGGFGAVYKVQHIRLDKTLALKVLFDHAHQNPRLIKRFEREARATCRIGHENIVEITDFARDSKVGYYFVMEYLVGETLGARLKKMGPLPADRLVHISRQIADALAATHAKGIVHRDLKPDNLFLLQRRSEEDFVKILDFGIAAMGDLEARYPRLTRHGQMLGTPAYMSPEQADGLPPDQRSDIYSLGIILYEMATGRVPYKNAASMAVLEMHRSAEPVAPRKVRPDLPPEIERIILRALRKDIGQRYQSMRELYHDLDALAPATLSAGVRVDSPLAPDPDDVQASEPEWLDDEMILLEDDDPGPTQMMAATEIPEPTVDLQPPSATVTRIEPGEVPPELSVIRGDRVVPVDLGDVPRRATPTDGFLPLAVTGPEPSEPRPAETTSPDHRAASPRPVWQRPLTLVAVGFVGTLALYGLFAAVHRVADPPAPSVASTARADTPATLTAGPATRPAVPAASASAVVPRDLRRTDAPEERFHRAGLADPPPLLVEARPVDPEERASRGLLAALESSYVSLDSDPVGAEVLWGQRSLGTTPLVAGFPLHERRVRLVFKADGHVDRPATVKPAADQSVRVKLRPQGAPPQPTRPPKGSSNSSYDLF